MCRTVIRFIHPNMQGSWKFCQGRGRGRVLTTSFKSSTYFTEGHEWVSEYDQEIPQSHTADQPPAPWERATEHRQSQDIRRTIKVRQLLDSHETPEWTENGFYWKQKELQKVGPQNLYLNDVPQRDDFKSFLVQSMCHAVKLTRCGLIYFAIIST